MKKRWLRVLVAIVAAVAPITMMRVVAFADANPQLVSLDNQGNRLFASRSQISRDGRYVLFGADPAAPDYTAKLYLRDRQTNTTQLVSTDSSGQTITFDRGDFGQPRLESGSVFFMNDATNGAGQSIEAVYKKDLATGALTVVSVDGNGQPTDAVSFSATSDGNTVEWQTASAALTVYVRDLAANTETTFDASQLGAALSGNGRYLFYTNPSGQVKRDLQLGTEITLGTPTSDVQVSDDGRYVSYMNQSGPAKYDTTGPNSWTFDTHGNGNCKLDYALSYDGSTMVLATATAANGGCNSTYHLYAETDADAASGQSRILSINSYGNQFDNATFVAGGSLNYDGSQVAFYSSASNVGVLNPGGNLAYVKSTQSAPPASTDTSKPIVSSLGLQNDTKQASETDAITMTATDDNSGVVTGEFFLQDNNSVEPSFQTVIGFSDLAYGFGTPMTHAGGTLTGTIGSDVPAGSYTVFARAQDAAGNWSDLTSAQLTVVGSTDSTPPTLGALSWTNNPKSVDETSTLTVPASDDAAGVVGGEYFIGDTDPGQGNGATMSWDGNNLSTTFGTDFPTGVYKISVRAQDAAGNWSSPSSDYLVVYNPDGPRMTGKKSIVPSLAHGDVLPGLVSTSQTDSATFGFSVKYTNQGVISSNSDLQLAYKTGTHCSNPQKAQNCHGFELNATSIAWLTTQDTNNSTGIFQGTATLVIDGITSTVQFRVTGVDGQRLDATSPDSFSIKIYGQNDNPNTATPLYQINPSPLARGNIKIL